MDAAKEILAQPMPTLLRALGRWRSAPHSGWQRGRGGLAGGSPARQVRICMAERRSGELKLPVDAYRVSEGRPVRILPRKTRVREGYRDYPLNSTRDTSSFRREVNGRISD